MKISITLEGLSVPPPPPCAVGSSLGSDGKCHANQTFVKEKIPINSNGIIVEGLDVIAFLFGAKKISAKKLKAAFPKPSTPSTGEGVG
jgi:hypothetical protein